eukprot:m.25185 g.25185  ORF g.25185 m.25185 type:complete len:331 (+) comp8838_c0_seq1:103-1095(+)
MADNQELLQRALGLFARHLAVEPSNYSIEILSGGLSNFLFKVEPIHPHANAIPTSVVRLAAGNASVMKTATAEIAVCSILSERGLGPRLLTLFEEGTVEEFLPGRPLLYDELEQPTIREQIAAAMRVFHTMPPLPLSRSVRLFDNMRSMWRTTIASDPAISSLPAVTGFDVEEEIDWLEGYLRSQPHQVVVCHNDIQENNIIFNEQENKLSLIDFEYVSYNFREFDIGNFFCELSILNLHPTPPNFILDPRKYPDAAARRAFVQAYLGPDATETEVTTLADTANKFALASHLMWSLWAFGYRTRPIEFDYVEYATQRIAAYFTHKAALLA